MAGLVGRAMREYGCALARRQEGCLCVFICSVCLCSRSCFQSHAQVGAHGPRTRQASGYVSFLQHLPDPCVFPCVSEWHGWALLSFESSQPSCQLTPSTPSAWEVFWIQWFCSPNAPFLDTVLPHGSLRNSLGFDSGESAVFPTRASRTVRVVFLVCLSSSKANLGRGAGLQQRKKKCKAKVPWYNF